MTTKLPGRHPQEQSESGPAQQDLNTAYQVHTLAQILYGQMAATYPWILGTAQPAFLPLGGPAMPAAMGASVYGPAANPPMAAQAWPGAWGVPAGRTIGYPWASCCFGSEFIPR
jgi:hypothetical protein